MGYLVLSRKTGESIFIGHVLLTIAEIKNNTADIRMTWFDAISQSHNTTCIPVLSGQMFNMGSLPDTVVSFDRFGNGRLKVAIDAPQSVHIMRSELFGDKLKWPH